MSQETLVLNQNIFSTHPDLVSLGSGLGDVAVPRHDQLFQFVHSRVIGSSQAQQEMPDRSLEEGVNDDWVHTQEYSHSTRVIEVVGSLAMQQELDATEEGIIAKETLRERFESSVIEMLHTDHEFRRKLEINRERRHVIVGDKVMASDGKTGITGIVGRGARSARLAAQAEPAMAPVAERCAADERVAKRVEALPVGGLLVGLSVDPKEAMAHFGKKFYEDKGFREGLAFLQWYYRIDEHTLLAATYSVDQSDLVTWREVWAEFGGNLPESEATDTWLDHDIQQTCTEEQARDFVQQIREHFYKSRGTVQKRYSVDEFMTINQSICDELFETLYMKLPIAHATRCMDPTLKTFVDSLLQDSTTLKTGIRQQLDSMCQSEKLSQADIALLEQLVRYSITERLREGLSLLDKPDPPVLQKTVVPMGINPAEFFAKMAAYNVLDGARAGRNYGGCTKSIDLTNEDGTFDPTKPQDAFGGLDRDSEEAFGLKDDKHGSRTFKCPKRGCLNTRWEKDKLLDKCQKCGAKIPRC